MQGLGPINPKPLGFQGLGFEVWVQVGMLGLRAWELCKGPDLITGGRSLN